MTTIPNDIVLLRFEKLRRIVSMGTTDKRFKDMDWCNNIINMIACVPDKYRVSRIDLFIANRMWRRYRNSYSNPNRYEFMYECMLSGNKIQAIKEWRYFNPTADLRESKEAIESLLSNVSTDRMMEILDDWEAISRNA